MKASPTKGPAWVTATLVLFLMGCQDASGPTAPGAARTIVPRDMSATISDGAHNNGNDDVFFLPPLVSNPNKQPGYGDAFAPGLPVSFRIRNMSVTGTPIVTEFGPKNVTSSAEIYQANWDTKASNLSPANTYRIEVVINSKTLAFADVKVGANSSDLKNVNTNEFITLVNGSTLPIRVRIEKSWNCVNHNSCVTEVVPPTIPDGQKVVLKSSDGNNSIAFQGSWYNP